MKDILTLVQLQQEGEVHLASIGGFDLIYDGERFAKGDGYRYETLLKRNGADYEVDLAITAMPPGAISRLEHALNGFEQERRQYQKLAEEARRRLSTFGLRKQALFAFVDELVEKKRALQVESLLASDIDAGTSAAAA